MLRAQGECGARGAPRDRQDPVRRRQPGRRRAATAAPERRRASSRTGTGCRREDALRAALADQSWQVALVDYNIPGFSGLEALRLIAEVAPDLPAVTVSGSIDEDTAVATMSAGAVDYVLKDNLTRLAPAVRRTIDGAELRRAHRRAAESARLALFAVDHASLSITTMAADGTVVYANDFACGPSRERPSRRRKLWELDPPSTPGTGRRVEGDRRERRARVPPRQASSRRAGLCSTSRPTTSRAPTPSSATAATSPQSRGRGACARERCLYRRIVEMANEASGRDAELRTTFVNRDGGMLGLEPRT